MIDLRSRLPSMANPCIKPFPMTFSRIALTDKNRGFLALEFGGDGMEKPCVAAHDVRQACEQEFGSCSSVSKEHAQRAPMGGL